MMLACIAPTLKPGDIVVTDNVSTHKVNGVGEAVGATLRAGAVEGLANSPPASPQPIA